jgi:predicted permease
MIPPRPFRNRESDVPKSYGALEFLTGPACREAVRIGFGKVWQLAPCVLGGCLGFEVREEICINVDDARVRLRFVTNAKNRGPRMKQLRIVLRQLARHPGFAAVSILTIGLCLAANLAIFAVVDAILLRPLPFPDSERLVALYNSYPKIGRERGESSYLNYHSRRGAIRALANVAALDFGSSIVGEAGSTEATEVTRVSAEFFETLGVKPFMGRAFTEAEMTYQTDKVTILTDDYWRTQFDADPSVIGRTVRVDGVAREVVGVLPPGFRFLSSRARLFLPLSVDRDVLRIQRLHNGGFEMIGRLSPGATLADAQAQIDVHNVSMNREFPYAKDVADGGFRTVVASLHGEHVQTIRRTLWLLQGGVLCLLLIGGVNLANLLMIRASARTQEFAVRQALGAGRRQVLGQALTESLGLALIGGGVGLVLATVGIGALRRIGVDQLPLGRLVEVTPRLGVVGLLAALLLGVMGGLFTAFLGFRAAPGGALPIGTRSGTATRAVQRLRHAFIVAQVAMALVLLVGGRVARREFGSGPRRFSRVSTGSCVGRAGGLALDPLSG